MRDQTTYVEQRDDAYWITGTRISLDSVVYAFLRSAAPESIVRSYPLLTLEQVYGAITYYLAHEQEINSYLLREEAAFAAFQAAERTELQELTPDLVARLAAARHKGTVSVR